MDSGLQAALRLLPQRMAAIRELVSSDENFRALCEDLADAERALLRWERAHAPEAAARCAEYRALIDDLEIELRQALREWQARPGQGRS